MKLKTPRPFIAPSVGRLKPPKENLLVGVNGNATSAETVDMLSDVTPRAQDSVSAKGLRRPLAAQSVSRQPLAALKPDVRGESIIFNSLVSDPIVGPSIEFSIKSGIPYFFVMSPDGVGGTQFNDAEEYFAEHEVDRIIASDSQSSDVLPHSGTLFLTYKRGQSAGLYEIGNLKDLEKDSSLFELIVDMSMFTYREGQDEHELQIVAKCCSALAFRFGEVVRRDVALAKSLVRSTEPTSAKYGFAFAMLHAVALGRTDMVAFCLDSGGTPLGGFRYGFEELGPTPIERAVTRGYSDMVNMMLRKITVEEGREWLPRLFSKERGWSELPDSIRRFL